MGKANVKEEGLVLFGPFFDGIDRCFCNIAFYLFPVFSCVLAHRFQTIFRIPLPNLGHTSIDDSGRKSGSFHVTPVQGAVCRFPYTDPVLIEPLAGRPALLFRPEVFGAVQALLSPIVVEQEPSATR